MNKRLLQVLATCSALVSTTASAETLGQYVNKCKTDFGILNPLPTLDCNDGVVFAPNRGGINLENDYLGYLPLNDNVDLVFACRWLGGVRNPRFPTAASVEMLIHARRNGSTCFFAANNPTMSTEGVSTTIVPPDAPGADTYWMQPAALDSFQDPFNSAAKLRCVGCHASGPYVASPRIAPFLARFGLINDGHVTTAGLGAGLYYHAVGSDYLGSPDPSNTSAFKAWDSVIISQFNDTDNNLRPDNACSGACHSIGYKSTVQGISIRGQNLMPPLFADINAVLNLDNMTPQQVIQTIMPPVTYSDYRWVNLDTPVQHQTGDTGDLETLQALQSFYPNFTCSNPSFVQAHAVGSDVIFDTSGYADKLHTFNVPDGLTCLAAEQTNSHACLDYQTRYQCSGGQWTPWINSPSSAPNDHEERTRTNIINTISTTCGRGSAVGIQARFTIPNTTNVVVFDGPPDRLQYFDKTGLRCNNADNDPFGAGVLCSNYVTRWVCPNVPVQAVSTLNSKHAPGDLQTVLTESTSVANQGINNQTFVSPRLQQWKIEPVTDFTNSLLWTILPADRSRAVRLRNVSTGFYATSNDINRGPSASAPSFFLLAQVLNQTWTTQIWIEEPVAPPNEGFVRLRSAWVPPPSKSTFSKLYMTLQTKNGDARGATQDVFVQPSMLDSFKVPVDVQMWELRGPGGPLLQ